MHSPFETFQNKVIVPIFEFKKKYLSKSTLNKITKKTSNFIFKYSKETALIMLGLNAVSILSSHICQIGGLRKSKRENKDYLITQEKNELLLDLLLTIIPSFMLNNALKKKLESGLITTKDARNKLINVVAPIVGASKDELYNIDYMTPVRETIGHSLSEIIDYLTKKFKGTPFGESVKLKKFNTYLKSKLPDYVTKFKTPNLEVITTDFDNLVMENKVSKNILSKFKNNSAYDELYGLNNGLLIITNIAYTILASNLIMPIIKNKLSNRTYEKQLKAMGETRESLKRKKRYTFVYQPPTDDIFTQFTKRNNTGPFNTFEPYNRISSQSLGLRI